MPFESNVFVNRFPIALKNGFKGMTALLGILTTRGDDRRMMGFREVSSLTADVRVWIALPGIAPHRLFVNSLNLRFEDYSSDLCSSAKSVAPF